MCVCPIFHHLRCDDLSRYGALARRVSDVASRVGNDTPRPAAVVHEVNGIDCLNPSSVSLSIKSL